MKIILSSSTDEFWNNIVKDLLDRNVQTTYWVGEGDYRNRVPKGCFFHEIADALELKGLYDLDIESFDISSIKINEYYTYLKILDRDDNIGGYSFSMRDRSLKAQLNYWYSLFKHIKPDAVVFSNVPHLAYQYPMYLVAKTLNIKTMIFNVTPFAGWYYVTEKILSTDQKSNLFELSQDISSIKQNFAAYAVEPYENKAYTVPYYIKGQIAHDEKNKQLIVAKKILEKASRRLSQIKASSEKQKSVRYNYFDFTGETGIAFKLSHFIIKERFKKRLQKTYSKSVTKSNQIDEIDKYIYVPLHYQPEATTAPNGGLYSDQIYMIEKLRAKLPKNVAIVVKEHYSQFTDALQGFRGRYLGYWDELLKVENLYLAPMDYDQKSLIIDSLAVATVTGTAGWEAIQYGKYSIIFGDSWYSSHLNAIRFKDLDTTVLNNIVEKVIPPDHTDQFLDVFCKSLIKSDLHNTSNGNITRSTNNVVDSIICFLNRENTKC